MPNPQDIAMELLDKFHPGSSDWQSTIKNKSFVYYTTAATALEIIEKGELWFRNASVMNDYSEISYGLSFVDIALTKPEGENFRKALDDVFPAFCERMLQNMRDTYYDLTFETYISCVSVHDETENGMGRLSMWRAYGDVALVLNSEPMAADTNKLGVFSVPVAYISKEQFLTRLNHASDLIRERKNDLRPC